MGDASDELVEALWAKVLEDWEAERAHDAFVSVSAERGRLGDAAARYRGQLACPDRKALAEKKMQAIAILAAQALESERTTTSSRAPRWIAWVAAVLTAAAVAVLVYAMTR
jgi:hypothetical protein